MAQRLVTKRLTVRQKKTANGFTLVELVAVIVLLGIVAISSTQFILQAVGLYRDSNRRDNLTQVGRFAVERVTRELRNALPGSVRVRSDAAAGIYCVEFVPITAATAYLHNLAGVPLSSIDVVSFDDPAGGYSGTEQVVIFPIINDDFYGNTDAYRIGLDSVSSAPGAQRTLALASPFTFAYDSPQLRLYIVDQPVSFCASNNSLTRHQGDGAAYTFTTTQPLPPGNSQLLTEFIRTQVSPGNAITVFQYQGATQQRNAVVVMDMRFNDASAVDEWVSFSQQVLLRNTQ